MKVKCPCCNEEINLTIFLNKEVLNQPEDETLLTIANVVCKNAEIDLEEFKEKTRKRNIVKARQQFVFLAKQYTPLNKTDIARFIGENFDHSFVIHSLKVIKDLMQTSSVELREMEYLIDKVEEILKLKKAG